MLAKLAPVVLRWFPLLAVFLLAGVFLWRRLFREFPFFFLYLVSAILVTAVRFGAIYMGRRVYFYSYWISDLAGSPVVFLAIYEVFLRRLFQGFHKIHFYRMLFAVAAAGVLLLTVLTALQANDKGAAFQMASRAFDFMRTAVLVFFIGLMMFMGREWTRYELGIALGFGIQASAALATAAVRAQMHYKPTFMDTVQAIAYNVSCVIWLLTFWKQQKRAEVRPDHQLGPQWLREARGWETILKSWLKPGKPQS